ncbi:RagB/SusD family nutrient uptake outer membrane protein [Flagellimonas sp.]|uniref:RagB/SusD family nutrient uptake outer membrane protein n=1 Tax=Flagellimonas sp. TaxID=2058762 RepID=UPI003BB083F5
MTQIEHKKHRERFHSESTTTHISARCTLLVVLLALLNGCTNFVEVDPPKNTLVSETVFDDPATVESALANLYHGMREQGMVSGANGLTPVIGIYADELDYYGFNADHSQLYQHNVLAANGIMAEWWGQAYQLIYGANDIINGASTSGQLSMEEKNLYVGQALFVRAYLHSLLANLFGDIPYVTTTDYVENNSISRLARATAQEKSIMDLEEALALFEDAGPETGGRIYPDRYVAMALLSRLYLHLGNWEKAETVATQLINAFPLEADLAGVFLKSSPETIWELKADAEFPRNTREAEQLIIQAVPGQTYALTEDLLEAFEPGDQRSIQWIGSISDSDNTVTLYYPSKYRAGINETESLEYSILFRSAEQVLIRAEARLRRGDITGAQADINAIRNRAGLSNTTATTENALMDAILKERRLELFTEQGHRWFDLARTGRADEVLGNLKPNWQSTDLLLPIPENELETNPNLLPQNPGY